jgi:hypothetical protein
MIEHTDMTILNTTTLKNKLGITDPQQLASAEADFTAFRLAELQTAPLRGGFDSVHLQEIHKGPSSLRPSRGSVKERGIERFFSTGSPLIYSKTALSS